MWSDIDPILIKFDVAIVIKFAYVRALQEYKQQ